MINKVLPISAYAGLILLATLIAPNLASAEPRGQGLERPKIGLVLSGGGARGAAHVGVLKVLDELRIPIDYIAGTSMGAAVSGLYASGMSPQELETLMVTLDWPDTFRDKPPRQDLSFRRKQDDTNFLVKFELGFKDGKFLLPRGLVSGQKLNLLLKTWTVSAIDIDDFDDLAIPFRAIATDIETGEAVVLDHGNLATAIRASMSVPSAYAPVQIDGRLLVDGGLSNNIPMDVTRDMGADVLIVVDIGTPLKNREKLGSVFDVSSQVLTILTQKNVQAQLETLKPQDTLIVPQLEGIGATDFALVAQAIVRGEDAALEQFSLLQRYSISEKDYQSYLSRVREKTTPTPVIDFIRIENTSQLSDKILQRKLRIKPGDKLKIGRIKKDLEAIYGLGNFERVDFELVREDERTGLIIIANAKPWGPNYIRMGLNLIDDFEGDSSYNLLVSYNMTEINPLGAEFKNEVQIGTTRRIFSEFYQPLDYAGRFFIAPRLEYKKDVTNIFQGDERIAEYEVSYRRAGLDLGLQMDNFGALRLGVIRDRIEDGILVGSLNFPDGEFDRGAYVARIAYDKLDNTNFPRHGSTVIIQWLGARSGLGADDVYDKASLTWLQALTSGKNTVLASIDYGSSLDTLLPRYDEFTLGGFLNLSGYRSEQLRGQHMALGRLIYYRRIGSPPSTALGSDLYLGGSIEAGNVWQVRDDISSDDLLHAGSLMLGMDTVVGPLYLAYGIAENKDQGDNEGFYLFLGRTF